MHEYPSTTVPLKVEKNLRLIFGDLFVHKCTVFRDNLFLEVLEHSGKLSNELAKFIRDKDERSECCGIVYFVLPHDVSKLHAELLKQGINAVKYHEQLSDEVKIASQT